MPPRQRTTAAPSSPPQWASRYRASDFEPTSYATDVIALRPDLATATLLVAATTRGAEGPFAAMAGLPGTFVARRDRTAADAARRALDAKTHLGEPPHLEALDTYDTAGRDPREFVTDAAGQPAGARVVSRAYLALYAPGAGVASAGDPAIWRSVYDLLPWEDLRSPAGRTAVATLTRALGAWVTAGATTAERAQRRQRVAVTFGLAAWNEERAGDRVRLLLETGLIAEAWRTPWGEPRADRPADPLAGAGGTELAFDHRLMVADALGRLRGKIKYVPAVVRAILPATFTFAEFLATCEAILGRALHNSNARRAFGTLRDLVVPTGLTADEQRSGPKAQLYRVHPEAPERLSLAMRYPFLPLDPP